MPKGNGDIPCHLLNQIMVIVAEAGMPKGNGDTLRFGKQSYNYRCRSWNAERQWRQKKQEQRGAEKEVAEAGMPKGNGDFPSVKT